MEIIILVIVVGMVDILIVILIEFETMYDEFIHVLRRVFVLL